MRIDDLRDPRVDDVALLHEIERYEGETDEHLRERIRFRSNPNNIIPVRPFLKPHD